MLSRPSTIRSAISTASLNIVRNYGASVGLRYRTGHGLVVAGNASFAQLDRKEANDGLEDGFNTPKWTTTVSISHDRLFKRWGAGLSYRYQSRFYYQSFLVNGDVPAVHVVDGQLTYAFANQKIDVKLGGTNLFNRYYYSILGGPQVGGFYYLTLTYGLGR